MGVNLKKRFANCISIMLILSLLIGCASTADSSVESDDTAGKTESAETADDNAEDATLTDDEIELIEPAGSALSFVSAEIRELSVVSTYQGVVCPDTYEYSYDSDQPFGNFNALPGDEVSAGDMLFYGTVEGLDDSIEEIEDENAVLLQEYNDYVSDYVIDIAKAKKEEFEAASEYQNMLSYAPDHLP